MVQDVQDVQDPGYLTYRWIAFALWSGSFHRVGDIDAEARPTRPDVATPGTATAKSVRLPSPGDSAPEKD
ncbi:hypothetical protein CCM_00794 [Cordyceps militaris CM01]|uniref:Uncharacterized protein n=1 Tax=Cordyceps militaris (strain CM01) TaxID=983644 RepID=G3J635_CORMM|nr:uncharacterized protein CCM_00794 [Cordyceps militaris CM01]EGX96139.1 hypothetical protein CCM_00794 [Cordyceps militaris CM01]